MLRYAFTLRTLNGSTRLGVEADANTLDDAERQVRERNPDAVRLILVAVEEPCRGCGDYISHDPDKGDYCPECVAENMGLTS